MPTQDTVIGDVAEEEIPAIAKPYRPFRPSCAGIEALDRCVANFVFCETRVNHFHGGVRIGHGIPPILFRSKADWFKCNRGREPHSQIHECASLHRFLRADEIRCESTLSRPASQRIVLQTTSSNVAESMIMPWLAAQKRKLSTATASAGLRADAAESAVCGYLALIALAGLIVNAIWKVTWADPVAALASLPLIVREGWEAWKGNPCCC